MGGADISARDNRAMGNILVKAASTSFGLQWGLFIIAAYLRTEKFYDISGSATFILLLFQSLMHSRTFFPRQVIQSCMVGTWTARLGLFLLMRVLRDGHDSRFNRVRDNPKRFLLYWTVQGLWVWLTLLPTLVLNSKREDKKLSTRDYVGWSLWLAGILLEALADYQKYTFRSDPANRDKWISHGVWSVVRHPNYLGEIMLWAGLFVSASSSFRGWDFLTVVSPLFVAYLLTKVSGIPILEHQNMRRWKDNPQFLDYLRQTPRLIPFLY